MDDGAAPNPHPRALSKGRRIGIAVLQLALVPVFFFIGFGFMFVGMGLNPDSGGESLSLHDGVVLGLYGVVFLTVLLLLLIGAPTLLIANERARARLQRRAAYIPLGFAAASAVILAGLWVTGLLFDRAAGV